MKLISWNVNGIRACIGKGFEESFAALDADIFCLQETKCQQGQVKLELPGYYQYWNYANRRDIPELLFLQRKSHCLWCMELELRNMTKKGV